MSTDPHGSCEHAGGLVTGLADGAGNGDGLDDGHPDGITAVDTEYVRAGLAASHIIAHEGRAAFVDTGTTHSVPQLLSALEELGLARDAVDYVILTHVHLDHAGGAGQLMRALPQARAVIHPRGAPHMIDPAKLIAGSMRSTVKRATASSMASSCRFPPSAS